MRVTLVHPYPVHAGAVGGTTRVYAFVRHLVRAGHAVTVLAHTSGRPEVDAAAAADLARLGAAQRLFPLVKPPLPRRLRWLRGPTPYFVWRNRNAALEAALPGTAPDVVHVEHGYLAPLLAGLPPGTARVLAEQETMSLAVARLRAARGRSPWEWYLLTQREKVAAFERRAFACYDRISGISDVEARHLAAVTGRPVGVVPHVVDTAVFTPPATPPQAPVALFVGNFRHRPNWHSLSWLLARVWPQVRAAVPGARLDVVGPGLEEAERAQVERAGGRPLGRVEDLPAAYRAAAVFANPIRSGGGMRGKVLEAFACGCPVVSTALGLEGIDGAVDVACRIADAPEEFGAELVRYLREPALRQAHGRAARALVERAYDVRVVLPRLEAELRAAVDARRRAA